jgi:hypothetical protein
VLYFRATPEMAAGVTDWGWDMPNIAALMAVQETSVAKRRPHKNRAAWEMGIGMTLSDFASIGSLISGMAVLLSLVYLNFQFRQTERNQQASIRQGRINRAVELVTARMQPSVAEAVNNGIDGDRDLTAQQLALFVAYADAYFLHAEDTYYQHEAGLLNESAFTTFVAYQKVAFTQCGMRVQWRRQRAYYAGAYVEFMDRLLAETSVSPAHDALADWRTDVSAERDVAAVDRKAPPKNDSSKT